MLGRPHGGLCPRAEIELAEDVGDVVLDRLVREKEVSRDHLAPQVAPQDLAAGVDPAAAWHPDVEQDDIGAQQRGLVDGVLRGGRLADDPDPGVGFEDRSQPKPDHLVVVGDQQANGSGVHRLYGNTASSRVPASGALSSSSVPPSSRTRSSIFARPWPCWIARAGLASTSNPWPSSSITSRAPLAPKSSESVTRVASACL